MNDDQRLIQPAYRRPLVLIHNVVRPEAFAFFHRAFAIAANLALPAALIRRRRLRPPSRGALGVSTPPRIRSNSFWSSSILPLSFAALRRFFADMSVSNEFTLKICNRGIPRVKLRTSFHRAQIICITDFACDFDSDLTQINGTVRDLRGPTVSCFRRIWYSPAWRHNTLSQHSMGSVLEEYRLCQRTNQHMKSDWARSKPQSGETKPQAVCVITSRLPAFTRKAMNGDQRNRSVATTFLLSPKWLTEPTLGFSSKRRKLRKLPKAHAAVDSGQNGLPDFRTVFSKQSFLFLRMI